ncbi:MAG: cytochrome P450 [Pseudomonadota bacterium]
MQDQAQDAAEQPSDGAGATAERFAPPRIAPLPDGASTLTTMRATIANPIAALPASIYESFIAPQRGGAMIVDPEILDEILVKRARDFTKTEINRRIFTPVLGQGLLSAEGEDWRWKRRLSAPPFAPSALEAMAPAFAAPFEALAARWAGAARAASQREDVNAAMVATTLDVIGQVLFADGAEIDQGLIARQLDAYLRPASWTAVGAILGAPEWTPYPGKGRQACAKRLLRGAVATMIAKRRNAAEAGEPAPEDLTTALLAARDPETGRPLSDSDMIDMVLTLVAAGHETTAHSLTWTLYCLAHQPALQESLAEEARGAASIPAGGETMAALPRIEAAVKETLRLFPVAPLIARRAAKPERFGDLDLPEGALISIPIYALHRHPALWGDPDAFDLDRFLGKQDPPRTRYMPFGAGPRICIGARMAMMEAVHGLAALLRALRFEPCEDTAFEPLHRVTLRPKDGLILAISARA